MTKDLPQTDEEWRRKLDEATFYVTRMKGTEPPFSGKFLHHKKEGIYLCKCCGEPLFASDAKYASECGWPSFYAPLKEDAIKEDMDYSHNMVRIEITCHHCGAHLGHVFTDGPEPTGLRYCVNSLSLDFRCRE